MASLISSSSSLERIVILGGGIQGTSLSYFLARKGIRSVVVENVEIAAAASGKAGGFLARNWGSGPTMQLHTKGYDLIESIAAELDCTSYRKIPTLSVSHRRSNKKPEASWLDREASSSILDESGNTAQISPYELTTKMMNAAIAMGFAEIKKGKAKGVIMDETGVVTGVKVDDSIIDCEKVVLCLGPWTGVMLEDWFNITIKMDGIKSTSLIYEEMPEMKSEPFALFCDDDKYGCHLEFYPRPSGELYICGIGGSDYVCDDRLREDGDCASADLIMADPKRVDAGRNSFKEMSSLGDRTPTRTQSCMRPCTSDGLPIMGPIPFTKGAFVSAGHNCWGILWSCISGQAMSEIVHEGSSKVLDLKAFDPMRFIPKNVNNRGRKKGDLAVGEQW